MSAVRASSPGLASLLDTEIDQDRVRLLDRLSPADPAWLYTSSQQRQRVDPTSLLGGPNSDQPRMWEGRSTLPALDRFQIWLFKGRRGVVYGRTVTMASFFIGPGYFALVNDESRRGDLVMRYADVPDPREVPKDWPAVIANDKAPAVIPYGQLEIVLRAARRTAFAGEAFRDGASLKTNVVLVPGITSVTPHATERPAPEAAPATRRRSSRRPRPKARVRRRRAAVR